MWLFWNSYIRFIFWEMRILSSFEIVKSHAECIYSLGIILGLKIKWFPWFLGVHENKSHWSLMKYWRRKLLHKWNKISNSNSLGSRKLIQAILLVDIPAKTMSSNKVHSQATSQMGMWIWIAYKKKCVLNVSSSSYSQGPIQ